MKSTFFSLGVVAVCILALSGCVSTAVQSPLVMAAPGTLGTQRVVVSDPASAEQFSQDSFIPLPMANSIAVDLAKRFPNITVVRPHHFAKIDGNLRRENLLFTTDPLKGSYVDLELEVTSWNPGNAFVRWLSSGISNSGEASLSIKATVVRISPEGVKSAPLAESIFTTASTGNLLYTGTASTPWTRAAREIAQWVGNQL